MTLLTTLTLGLALAAPAQTPSADTAASFPAAAESVQISDSAAVISAPAEAPARVNSGLPARAPVARTMAAYWPAFALFTLVWAGIVAYTLTFGKRSASLAAELERLERERGSGPTA